MIGHIVSHYRILQKMGGGGMGVVYKAEDLKLRRTVALKFLAPELTRDEDAKKRFLHEAQAASALDHPNICGIHEIDETPEGQLFIAMTCYDGESLKERLARRKVDVEEAFQISFAVAQGLGRAHASDIIHRDIKPGNVMITNDGFVKIIDFGLSKLIGRSRVTGSGATLGTVAYMSPEQARSEEVDARADIWALGAILYEMLTGRVPFRGEIDQAVVYSILNEEPAPIRSLRPDVPEACAAVVMKCLAKDPSARYQSAEDFCVAVFEAGRKLGWQDSFVAGGVRAVSVVRGRETGRRRRRALYGVAALVVVTAAVAGWRVWRADSVYSTEVRLAVLPLERLGDTPPQVFVDGLSYCAATALETAATAHPSMWVVPYHRTRSDRPAADNRLADAFGVNRVVVGSVVPYEAGHRLTLELMDAKSMRVVRDAAIDFTPDDMAVVPGRITQAVAEMLDIDASRFPAPGFADNPAAVEAMGRLMQWRAGDNAQAAERLLAEALAADPSPELEAALGLARCRLAVVEGEGGAANSGRLAAAETNLLSAIAAKDDLANARLWLSYVYLRSGRNDERIRVLEEAVAKDPRRTALREELGWAYKDAQRYSETEAAFTALSEMAPDYYYPHFARAWVYRKTGREAEELRANERALALAPAAPAVLNNLGVYYDAAGDLPRAREYYERSFLIKPDCAGSSNVARVLYLEGRYRDATMYNEYAIDMCDTTNYEIWANLAGSLYYVEGGRPRSLALYRKCLRMAGERLSRVPDDTRTAAMMADYHSMLGEREAALALAAKAAGSTDPAALFRLAQVYENFGQRTQALDLIGDAMQNGFPLHEITNEPMLRELVKDARFTRMLDAAKENS